MQYLANRRWSLCRDPLDLVACPAAPNAALPAGDDVSLKCVA